MVTRHVVSRIIGVVALCLFTYVLNRIWFSQARLTEIAAFSSPGNLDPARVEDSVGLLEGTLWEFLGVVIVLVVLVLCLTANSSQAKNDREVASRRK